MLQKTKKTDYTDYIKNITSLMPKKITLAISLMVLSSFTEGIALVLLIPLLQLVGLDVQQGSTGQISDFLSSIFAYLHFEPTLITVLGIYVLITAGKSFISRWQTMTSIGVQNDFALKLRKELYSSINNTSWIFFSKMRSSDFAHALTAEIDRIGTGTYQFLFLISNMLIMAVYIIFALKLSGIITLVILIASVVLLILLKNRDTVAHSRGKQFSKIVKELYTSTIQHLDGMKAIKSYGLQEKNYEEFSRKAENIKDISDNTVSNFAVTRFFFEVGSVLILSILIIVLVYSLSFSSAGILILLFIFSQLIPKFSSAQQSYQYFLNMLPSYSNVMNLKKRCDYAKEPNIEKSKEIDLNDTIKLENISFSYENEEFLAVRDINMSIKAGEITAIVGPSGAGKSTIADIIIGLITPKKGNVTVDGTILDEDTILSWRERIGYVAQETFLFNDTVRSNLLLARPDAPEKEIEEVLELVAANKFVSKLPEGMDTLVGDRGVRFSGGERQRLALAQALLRKPSLLILDEATSNLDSENEKRILGSIEKLHGSLTTLMIAHRLSTVRKADIIYLIEDGQIIESGSWDELIKIKDGRFRAICESQGLA